MNVSGVGRRGEGGGGEGVVGNVKAKEEGKGEGDLWGHGSRGGGRGGGWLFLFCVVLGVFLALCMERGWGCFCSLWNVCLGVGKKKKKKYTDEPKSLCA